jgi:hypothetical protein
MAYKQTPGRSPFLKTGRGIPLNMISPLHDHKPGHPKDNTGENAVGAELSETDIKKMPGYHDPGGDVGVRTFTEKEMNKAQTQYSQDISRATNIDRYRGISDLNNPPGPTNKGGLFSDEMVDRIKSVPSYEKRIDTDAIRGMKKIIDRGTKGIIPSGNN